jgi:predicted nucleic acid-binding protein
MQIERIDHTSAHLAAVKTLGRANGGTLGLFPEGAFDDYAYQKHIIIAVAPDDGCVGYVLYRITRGWAIVVHLCVDTRYGHKGVAAQLVDRLCTETQSQIGIRADCRRDYGIDHVWERLGFHAAGERRGRSKAGTKLTIWLLKHGPPDLFTRIAMERVASKLLVAIDANVFYDLIDPTRPGHEESQALLADCLSDEIELTVSDELWNEINRGPDEQQRERTRAAAGQFHRFQTERLAFDAAQRSLQPLFPAHMRPNDASDLRQLARAIVGKVPFFVTRDERLLDRAVEINQAHGIAIRRPSDFVIQLDELRRQQEYQPARLAGTTIELRRVQSQEQSSLSEYFQHDGQGETRSDFEHLLRRLLAAPKVVEGLVARDAGQTPLLLVAYDRSEPGRLIVPLVRVRHGPLAPTLARYLLLTSVVRAAREGRQLTIITDPTIDPMLSQALQQDASRPTPSRSLIWTTSRKSEVRWELQHPLMLWLVWSLPRSSCLTSLPRHAMLLA